MGFKCFWDVQTLSKKLWEVFGSSHKVKYVYGAEPKKYCSVLKFMQMMVKMSAGTIKKQKRSILLFKLCKTINHTQSYGYFNVYFWGNLLNFLKNVPILPHFPYFLLNFVFNQLQMTKYSLVYVRPLI